MFKFNKVQVAPSTSKAKEVANQDKTSVDTKQKGFAFKGKSDEEVLDGEIEALKSYFSHFDGSPNAWNNIKDILPTIFHQDLVMKVGNNEVYTYTTFAPLLQAWVEQQGVSQLAEVQRVPGQKKLIVSILNTPKGAQPMMNKMIYTFKGSKVVHQEAVLEDQGNLESLITGIKQKNKEISDDTVQALQNYFSQFNGSCDAWGSIVELIPKIFDHKFEFRPDQEQIIEYNSFTALIREFVMQGGKAELMNVERFSGEGQRIKLKVTVCNTLKNSVGEVSDQIWTYEGDKVLQIEALTQDDEAKLGGLTKKILSSRGSEVVTERDIELLKLYFSKFGGCCSAWDTIKDIVPRVFHPKFKFSDQKQVFEYAPFVSLLHSWVSQGGKSDLVDVKRMLGHSSQLLLVVRNTPKSGFAQVTRQIVTYNGSKIIEGKAMPGKDSEKLGELVEIVLNKTSKQTITENDIETLKLYFSKIDGSGVTSWEDHVKHLLPQIFHPEVVFLPEDSRGGFQYDAFNTLVHEFVAQYGKAEILDLKRLEDEGDKLQLTILNTPLHSNGQICKQIWTYRGGKVIEIRTVSDDDKEKLETLVDSIIASAATESEVVADEEFELLKTYFSKFDGSETAWTNVKDLVPLVFHPEFAFSPDENKTYSYEPFVSLLQSFVGQGGKADLMAVQRIMKGLKVMITVCNTTRNGKGKISKQILTYRGTKVVSCTALPGEDSDNLLDLVTNVLRQGVESSSETIGEKEIDTLKLYFSKIDGSGINTWDNHVKDLFAQVFHPDFVFLPEHSQLGLSYDSFNDLVRGFIEQQGKAEILSLERLTDKNQIKLTVRNTPHNGEGQISRQIWTYRGGKVIENRAVSDEDGNKLSALVQSVFDGISGNAMEHDMLLLEEYLSRIDGSTDAWEKHVETLIPQMFHKDFKFILNNEESLDYDGMIDLVRSFIAQGRKADLIAMKPLANNYQLLLTTRNTDEQQGDEIATKLMTYKDSKIVHVETVPEDKKRVEVLYKKVLQQSLEE